LDSESLLNKSIESIDDLDADSYLGYITLRPLPTNFISNIVMKPNKNFYDLKDSEKLFMITVNQEVHIGNKKIEFPTFPFFHQDSMVTVCAHADMWMVANIMHKKYELDEISIEKLVSGISPSGSGRNIPSEGLTMEQLAYSIQANRWYARIKYFSNKSDNHTIIQNVDKIMQYIDSSIESGIPCMLAFNNHVIVIAGHTVTGNKEREYIIFDDSGHHIMSMFNEPEPKFSIKVSLKKLSETLLDIKNDIFLLCPEFERVYFPLKSVHQMMRLLGIGISKNMKISKDIRNTLTDIIKNKNYRTLIIDCKKLKTFFSENNINTFNECSLPHYIWFVEMYSGERGNPDSVIGYMLFDASAHQSDFKYSFITDCNGKIIIKPVICGKEKVMSLLEEFK